MELEEQLRRFVSIAQCDFFGVADLAPIRDFIREQGGDVVASFPRAISIGIALPHAIVDQLPHRDQRAVAVNYRTHAYDVINQRLNEVASQISTIVQRAGYAAFPIPAAARVDDTRQCAVFSHKLAAHLAGLGWIGKNCLLITPQVGPRARWISVLTDAPLPPTGSSLEEQCGECRECVDICPVQAYTNRNFRPEEPRELRYDAAKCNTYLYGVEQNTGMRVCGMCLYVCPYGRRR